jgi:hypothetical protein
MKVWEAMAQNTILKEKLIDFFDSQTGHIFLIIFHMFWYLCLSGWSVWKPIVQIFNLISKYHHQTDFSKRLTSWKANTKFENPAKGKTFILIY